MTGLRQYASLITKDRILFWGGLAAAYHEIVIYNGAERFSVLVLIAGALGLPTFLKADATKKNEP